MKNLIKFSILLLIAINHCIAQKRIIDTAAISHWEAIGNGLLSSDDKYFAYESYINHKQTLFIERTKNLNQLGEIKGGASFNFTANRDIAVFMKGKDTLVFFDLSVLHREYICGVNGYKLSPDKKWIAYQKKGVSGSEIHLRNLFKFKEQIFDKILDYRFSNDKTLFLHRNDGITNEILLIEMLKDKPQTIWRGEDCSNFTFSRDGFKFAFVGVADRIGGTEKKEIWYFDNKQTAAIRLWKNAHDTLLLVSDIGEFSKDGNHLLVNLKRLPQPSPVQEEMAKVDIWSYTDGMLQSEQSSKGSSINRTFRAIFDIKTGEMTQIEGFGEHIVQMNPVNFEPVRKLKGNGTLTSRIESYWNVGTKESIYLTSTKKEEATHQMPRMLGFDSFSPDGRYYIFVDRAHMTCYSYDLSDGRKVNLTADMHIPIRDTAYDESPAIRGELRGAIRWLSGKYFLIGDKFDLWVIDPSGKNAPTNLTNGFGRKHNIIFEVADYNEPIPAPSHKLLLKAVNNITKESGFFSTDLKCKLDPKLLSMGRYHDEFVLNPGDHPLNDSHVKTYTVLRQSASSSPNFYQTKDFKSFKPLTNTHPEDDYNWLTAELINFRSQSGYPLQAVVYKPGNFDTSKKYPVIINYYEKLTQHLNEFRPPELSGDNINIPWFVSRGYIVVTPDIHYIIGEPGKSAVNAVVGVTKHLISLPYIDSTKIGIQGHSWGGFETNYLVTHTGIFAAAMSASGSSDEISHYGSVSPGYMRPDGSRDDSGYSLQFFSDIQQDRIGHTLWEKPDLYIENSPIFKAYDVTTPVLMMNNQLDGRVPFSQGVEFFTALRRLGKRVWMLQYDGEGHGISEKSAKYDYTMRIQQFFDHYLKGLPAPVWMTRGIPASLKGTTDGFEYDKEIKTPPPSPLIDPTKDPKIIYDYN